MHDRADEVRRVLERWFTEARLGYSDGFTARLSQDPGSLTIGSDEAEWYRGDAVHQVARAQMADLGGRLPMYERETEAWADGNVAWAAARVDIRLDEEESLRARRSSSASSTATGGSFNTTCRWRWRTRKRSAST